VQGDSVFLFGLVGFVVIAGQAAEDEIVPGSLASAFGLRCLVIEGRCVLECSVDAREDYPSAAVVASWV